MNLSPINGAVVNGAGVIVTPLSLGNVVAIPYSVADPGNAVAVPYANPSDPLATDPSNTRAAN